MKGYTKYLISLFPLTASAYWKGFNLAAKVTSTQACKTQADWENDFNLLRSLPGSFTSVRLYASSDCDTLANAVPAALKTGTTILAGVWTEDDAHYEAEKAALLSAIQKYGSDWLIAVSVGSEDLYRGDTDANTLANKIHDVRGMLWGLGAGDVQVGHTDTWTAWVDTANNAVTKACDFVLTDNYPYFQGTSIEDSAAQFWTDVNKVRDIVNQVNPGAWVWIGETGEPVSGDTMGNAVPSVANAQTYWKQVACAAFNQAHTFWYILQDYNVSPSFGVVDANNQPLFDLTC